MANPPPLYPSSFDSQTSLLRKITQNLVLIANSGSGASLPAQAGHNGEFLTTDGLAASWAAVSAGGASRQTAANAAGDTTLTAIAASIIQHTAVVTVTGAARTSNIALPVTNRTAGHRAVIKLILPTTAAIIIVLKNATTGGTTLYTLTTDTSGDDASYELEYDGAAWQPLRYNYPI